MKAFVVFSLVVVSALAQHPAELDFDSTAAIQRAHSALLEHFPTPAPPVRALPVRPLPTPRPRQQQQAGLLAGHLAGHLAGQQAPHRFESPPQPIKKWNGPFAHELPAGVQGSVGHTQFTPEVAAAHRFIAQAHINHVKHRLAI
ncbi:unnamed protein product [Meganyctiphanes norvegica]|uniref:Uncharacterized protein n=1 Tax=Meganyctiphanes norvegica TaxID=48144 RepID=A0AAV2R3Y7_MEGNR